MEKEQELILADLQKYSPKELKDLFGIQFPRRSEYFRTYTLNEAKAVIASLPARAIRTAKPKTPCEVCSLKGRKEVPSSGDLATAKVVFVGQAPGRNEAEQGEPFVGNAGQLLRDTLNKLEFNFKELAFANVCRCYPPSDRSPTKKEIQSCMRHLIPELSKFQGLVVLLGAVPLRAFLKKSGISKNRGYGFYEDGKRFFATYHPSFILRNREGVRNGETSQVEDLFRYDLNKVKKYLDKKPKIKYNIINNRKELATFMSNLEGRINEEGKVKLSFDIETNGLDPLTNTKILSIAFSTGDESWFLPLEHSESVFRNEAKDIGRLLNPVFGDENVRLVGQGGKFDVRFLTKKYGIEITNYWFDTKLAHFLMEGKLAPHTLKSMVWRYTEYGGYDTDRTSLEDLPLNELADYNVMDAFVQYKLMEIYWKQLSEKQRYLVTDVLCPAVLSVAEMENEGVMVDEEVLDKNTEEYSTALQEIEKRLHEYPEIVTIEEEKKEPVNFNSGDQIREVFSVLGIKPKKRTKKRQAVSTDEEALKEVKGKHPITDDILKYREKDKILGTYLKSYKEKMVNGSVHGDYWFIRTETGRLACQKPNFQNIPYKIRPVFMAKNDFLVEVDFSQLELRVLAMYSKDEALIEAFNSGKDIHEETRQAVFGDATGLSSAKKTKQRVDAKTINFSVIYLTTAFGLAKKLKTSEKKAQQWIDAFYTKYPRAKDYIDEMKHNAKHRGYVETFFGRRRYFNFQPGLKESKIAHLYREAVNTPIQSAASDLVLKAMGLLWREMRRRNMRSRNVAQVHDLVLYDTFDKELEDLVEIIRPTMEHPPFDFINVPLVVDIKMGTHWGELEEI